MCVCMVSHVQLFVTPRTAAFQTPQSMESSRQECWNSFPSPTPGGLPHSEIESEYPASSVLAGGFFTTAAAAAKSLQSCPTLCNPIRRQPTRLCCPWDSPGKNTGVGCHSFSNAWEGKVKVKSLSRVWLLLTPWTATYQASLSVGFSRQEYWSGEPLASPSLPLSHQQSPLFLLTPP